MKKQRAALFALALLLCPFAHAQSVNVNWNSKAQLGV
jgi:hypothetical protein